jgi:hypothetical protein
VGEINGMDEATIEDSAFLIRPQGKPVPPASRECLSTDVIKKRSGIFSVVSHQNSDLTGGAPRLPMREVREWRKKSEGSKAISVFEPYKMDENLRGKSS